MSTPDKVMARVKDLFFTREFIRYFFSGVIATIVDNIVFKLLSDVLGLGKWYFSILPATVASVVVAYVLNRLWVFRSTDHLLKEFLRFTGTRVAISLFFTYLVYPIMYFGLNITYELFPNLPIAKLIALLFVILGNRLSGKFYVFREEHRRSDEAEKDENRDVSEVTQDIIVDPESTTTIIRSDNNAD